MSQLLQEWVSRQAELRPGSRAIVQASEQLTYGQLDRLSNQIARMLKLHGSVKGDRVCVLMPKSPLAVACIVGIYKADCTFVPLDPGSPAPRLARILEACESRCILAAGQVETLLGELVERDGCRRNLTIGWLQEQAPGLVGLQPAWTISDVRKRSHEPLSYDNSAVDAAHILFTSGSTGIPKGVVITHSNVDNFLQWARRYFEMSSYDRVSGHPPLHFDLSTFDMFGAFSVGAELHLVPQEVTMLPNKLADWIRTSRLTQWFSVPSVLNYMAKFDVLRFDEFPTLKRVLWCGEVLPTPALVYWMKRLPHVTFTNLYGPTETTIASSYYTVPWCPKDETEPIPIGSACGGEELLVLNDSLQPVQSGQTGELYIRGSGVSPGYWKDPNKTDEAFLRNPESTDPTDRIYRTGDLARVGCDGLVYFLGRVDSQIKSRGYRIELGEIESAVHTIDALRECAVVAIPSGGFEGSTICCAYVPAPGRRVKASGLRSEVASLLPGYMIPARWMPFRELPKNANGKIDRRRLKEMMQEAGSDTPRYA